MPAGKFTIPNKPSYIPTVSELLGAQLPEYDPGYTGQGSMGLEEPMVNEMDLLLALAPILKLGKVPLGALGSMRGSWSTKYLEALGQQAKTGKITAYHGTTKELGNKIMQEGFDPVDLTKVLKESYERVGIPWETRKSISPEVRKNIEHEIRFRYKSGEFGTTSFAPTKEVAKRWAGKGGEIAHETDKSMREYLLAKKSGLSDKQFMELLDSPWYNTKSQWQLGKEDIGYRDLGEPAVVKAKIVLDPQQQKRWLSTIDAMKKYLQEHPEEKDLIKSFKGAYRDFTISDPLNMKPVKLNLLDMELEDALKYMKGEKPDTVEKSWGFPKLTGKEGEIGSFSTKKLTELAKRPEAISKEERRKILSSFITSPEREKILSPEVLQQLEDFFVTLPKGTKAHAFGSATVPKVKSEISDFDTLIEYLTGKEWKYFSEHPEKLPKIPNVDLVPSPPLERVPNEVKKINKIGRERYGPDYKGLIRILSALGILTPLSGMIGGEAQAQEVNPNWGLRLDGTPKGPGWLGTFKDARGLDATEKSIGVSFDEQERLIPSLVPTLTSEEVDHILQGKGVTKEILRKAVEHARMLLEEGKSPFLGKE